MAKELFELHNIQFQNIISYPDYIFLSGKTNFIVGESGSGKSTLLRLLNNTLSPSKGELFYFGKSIYQMDSLLLRKEVSLVSQNVFLFDDTIEGNFHRFYNYVEKAPLEKDDIKKFLQLCCLPLSLAASCSTMSGGERQRVYISIFLSLHPKVLLLDEPTSALDSSNAKGLLSNIIVYSKENEIDMIFVSHNTELTNEFSEHTVELRKKVNHD